MRKFCRSKKRRIIKKWFKRTGRIRCKPMGKLMGLYLYYVDLQHVMTGKKTGKQNRISIYRGTT